MKRTMGFVALATLGVTVAGLAAEVRLVSRPEPSQVSRTPAGDSKGGLGRSMSDDGRYVVFVSAAPNVSPGQNEANGISTTCFFGTASPARRPWSATRVPPSARPPTSNRNYP